MKISKKKGQGQMSNGGGSATLNPASDNALDEKYLTIKLQKDVPKKNLPSGWIGIWHQSGGIIYLHKPTKVITWSRPYQLSKSTSARKHDVPLTAIPCLHQKAGLYSKSFSESKEETQSSESSEHNSNEKADKKLLTQCKFKQVTNEEVNHLEHKRKLETDEGCKEKAAKLQCFEDEIDLVLNSKPNKLFTSNNFEAQLLSFSLKNNNTANSSTPDTESKLDSSKFGEAQKLNPINTNIAQSNCLENSFTSLDCALNSNLKVNNFSLVNSHNYTEPSLTLPKNDPCSIILEKASNNKFVDSQMLHEYLSGIFSFEESDKEYIFGLPIYTDADFDEQAALTTDNQRKKKQAVPVIKNPLQKLYEYCQLHFKKTIAFNKLDECFSGLFYVEVLVGFLRYGVGQGDNKKNAKYAAAQATLEIMDPKSYPIEAQEKYFEIFDKLSVEDPTIFEKTKSLMSSYSLIYPYEMMVSILTRQYGLLDFNESEIDTRFASDIDGGFSCTLTVKSYKVTAAHQDRKIAKNLAAQYILKKLHPELTCWGSIMRLHKSVQLALLQTTLKDEKEKTLKNESQSERIINILHEEMRKIGK
ncbi:microprocessor complex subunit DGCR8 isoform X2 [Hydra vulgaris]|uniref:Microprocessor complex subunit DGCR8 isoform X2 n=1 Tax=Hydra vulgaris TaxID=6087 RepID=A0ABM4BF75_HYDVU